MIPLLTNSKDVAAVVTPLANQDIVFHINSDLSITYWSSKTSDETQGEQYNASNLKVNGNPIYVNKDLPVLAAVAYSGSGCNQDEVHYPDLQLDSSSLANLW